MPPARGIHPSREGVAGSWQPNPSVHQQQGRPPQAVTMPWLRLTPIRHPPVRGQLGPNYDARSIIHSRQLARRDADVDYLAADAADAH
jgi:hypothetical protein